MRFLLIFFIGGLSLIVFTGCSQRAKQVENTYSTAYVILTKTAAILAKLPSATATPVPETTETPTPSQSPTLFLSPGPEQITESNPLPPATVPVQQLPQQATSPPAEPTPNPPSVPVTNLPLATNTQNPALTQIPATSTPPVLPPSQGLVGIWQQDSTGAAFQFNADNTYALADSFGEISDNRFDEGQYSILGDQVILTGSTQSTECKGLIGSYQFQNPANNQRQFIFQQDNCAARQSLLPQRPWYWLPIRPGATPAASANEQPVRIISLSGPLTNIDAKITGLAWLNDRLLLLPFLPTFTADGKAILYVIDRTDLTAYLNGVLPGPLSPQSVPLLDGGLSTQLVGFQGYQAMAVSDDRIVVLVQADPGSGVRSYLVAGTIASDLSSITLDSNRVVEVPAQPGSTNRIYHAMLISNDSVLVIPALSGAANNSTPVIQRFDKSLNILGVQSMSGIEYLVTDASMPESDGRFWVVNKFAPGDPGAINGLDPLAQLYGEGMTHQVFDQVERLLPLQINTNGISLAALQPLQLELSAKAPRNWQAVADMGEAGFIIAANQSTGLLLAFVEKP